jgi:hypothetical protein
MIWSSDMSKHTYIGNKELHARHRVSVEPGPVPRATVRDQNLIDRYLEDKLITSRQHHAGEYFLQQAGRAGVWPKGVNWNMSGGDKGRPNYVPFGAFPYGKTLAVVRKRYGEFHAFVLNEVIVHGWDVSHNDFAMTCLKEALDWVADRRMGFRYDPVAGLKTLAAKRAARGSATCSEGST